MPAMAHASSLSEVSPDRADDVAGRVPDQHAAGIGDHAPAARRRQHGEELRSLGRAPRKRARAEAHAERAPGFAEGDVEAQEPRLVLALERDEVPAGIEHGDGERRAIGIAALLERGVDNGGGLRERDDGHGGSIDAVMMVSSSRKRGLTFQRLVVMGLRFRADDDGTMIDSLAHCLVRFAQ
jgi:hypothetical protein